MEDRKLSSELIYRIVDILVIVSVLVLGAPYTNFYNTEGYVVAGLSAIVCFSIIGRFTEIYTSWSGRSFGDEMWRVASAWVLTYLGLIFIAFATKTSEQFSRLILIAWLIATPIFLVFCRYLLRLLFNQLKQYGINNRRVVIAGMTASGLKFAKSLEKNPEFGYHIDGFFDDRTDSQRVHQEITEHFPHLGNFEKLVEGAREGTWDQIYIALPMEARQRIKWLLQKLSDSATPVRLLPDYFTSNLVNSKYITIAENPVLCVYDSPFSEDHAFIKRVEDIVLSILFIIILAPFMLAIAVAVKATSKGPILFKQNRYGLRGEKIKVWKFRTMNVMEDGNTVTQAQKDDNRFTPIGEFLRRTSMDELPQFFNVLQGHMSVVGPRPHAVAHNEQYRALIPGYMLRHMIKPGITGWAQINGWRGETSTVYKMRKRVEYDLEYMREWSLWLDIKIIFLTAIKALNDKNAY